MDLSDVTPQMVKSSLEGLEHYACLGLDISARGAAGQALNRALDKAPQVKQDVYKWLTEDLKKKFRATWAIERSFEKVVKQRVRTVRNVTRQQELGSWKSHLQLCVFFGGSSEPEAIRQADNYVAMCRQFGEVFCEWNVWTKAENFLLVEKLSSSTQEEEWKEIASQCDCSPTYETEAYQIKARRKFAAAKGLPFEAVSLKDIEDSDLGLQGYAEMIITVPGIEVVEDDSKEQTSGRKTNKRKQIKDEEKPAAVTDKNQETAEKQPKQPKTEKTDKGDNKKPKAKAKPKEASAKDAENGARHIVLQIQRATQTMDRLQESLADEPWAVPLMKEFKTMQAMLKEQLAPKDGDNIQEFVNELKICVFSGTGPGGLKTLKKQYKDRYVPNLALFADRCKGPAQQ
ncbi:unnamed protein product [Symbiodinium sp. CCMP2456]|nr:unnamed protein product [Symbiodinium sp. CCMP2456]